MHTFNFDHVGAGEASWGSLNGHSRVVGNMDEIRSNNLEDGLVGVIVGTCICVP